MDLCILRMEKEMSFEHFMYFIYFCILGKVIGKAVVWDLKLEDFWWNTLKYEKCEYQVEKYCLNKCMLNKRTFMQMWFW